jgi:hypothetical protein
VTKSWVPVIFECRWNLPSQRRKEHTRHVPCLACLTQPCTSAAEYIDAEKQAERTFIDYAPSRLRDLSSLCKAHPDPVTETSALNSIMPPPITCKIKIPKSVIERGLLTDLQLESILYACDQHQRMLPCDKSKAETPFRGVSAQYRISSIDCVSEQTSSTLFLETVLIDVTNITEFCSWLFYGRRAGRWQRTADCGHHHGKLFARYVGAA